MINYLKQKQIVIDVISDLNEIKYEIYYLK